MEIVKVRRFSKRSLNHESGGEWMEQTNSNFNGAPIKVGQTVSKTRFEFEFQVSMKLSCVYLLDAKASGSVIERIMMEKISLKGESVDGHQVSVKGHKVFEIKPGHCSSVGWKKVIVELDSSNYERIFIPKFKEWFCEALTPLHICLDNSPDDFYFVCKDGKSVGMKRAVAMATMDVMSTFFTSEVGNDKENYELKEFDASVVQTVKKIVMCRYMYDEDVSDLAVVELLHYLHVKGSEKVWPLVIRTMSATNCMDIMGLASTYDNELAMESARKFLFEHPELFRCIDHAALSKSFAPIDEPKSA